LPSNHTGLIQNDTKGQYHRRHHPAGHRGGIFNDGFDDGECESRRDVRAVATIDIWPEFLTRENSTRSPST
jgi:hypothetical protein